ncbi:hypothetical protein [Flavisolibacter ginsengisoli]|jgi:hypothetical protein|uniref:Uncharacterized protein n=1 Tax=Flavisolibacter ginsengisoli DSM 18119 TaxID=1121884 RepID=A0A1M5DWX1_9BACT|nr:hypothetical protein [Flavisolibacter ginsengisoli]SHF71426.1 hypothetical protein SAMN02745131_03369 [Flavisolibacter ginsengisoli DSM 18119]
MIRHSLLYLVIALIATIEYVSGFAVSIVPGWQSVIVPPFMILSIFLLVWLYCLPIGYAILEKKNNLPPQRTVFIHLFLTLCFFFYSNGVNSLYNTPNVFLRFAIPLGLFAIGQMIYIISFFKALKRTTA